MTKIEVLSVIDKIKEYANSDTIFGKTFHMMIRSEILSEIRKDPLYETTQAFEGKSNSVHIYESKTMVNDYAIFEGKYMCCIFPVEANVTLAKFRR